MVSNLVGGLEHEFMTFHILGRMIPTDEVILFRGVETIICPCVLSFTVLPVAANGKFLLLLGPVNAEPVHHFRDTQIISSCPIACNKYPQHIQVQRPGPPSRHSWLDIYIYCPMISHYIPITFNSSLISYGT